MRTPIIVGNWKAYLTLREAETLVRQLKSSCETDLVDVAVCPPFTALAAVAELLKGSRIGLGAQDVFWEPQGAFTGEVTPPMLVDVGCRYVIIGHSERRTHFGETDESVGRKLLAALAQALIPIVCIGETLAEREGKRTFDILSRQLAGALKPLSADDAKRLILAYEPVWAIGTGRNATPEQAQEAHAFIRGWLGTRYTAAVADAVRIQYGGSVNASNAASLLHQADVDGALVGGASLKADAFAAIVKAAVDASCDRGFPQIDPRISADVHPRKSAS
jgi:triosephosphate isomerase